MVKEKDYTDLFTTTEFEIQRDQLNFFKDQVKPEVDIDILVNVIKYEMFKGKPNLCIEICAQCDIPLIIHLCSNSQCTLEYNRELIKIVASRIIYALSTSLEEEAAAGEVINVDLDFFETNESLNVFIKYCCVMFLTNSCREYLKYAFYSLAKEYNRLCS